MQELKTISSADLAGKLHSGQPDTPDIGADAMQELFDAHPNLNTEVINENAARQNENNKEVSEKLAELAEEDSALSGRVDAKAEAAQVNAKFAALDAEDEHLSDRIDTKAEQEAVTAALAEKVDKVAGKQLSTNDYDDAAVEEVEKISLKADELSVAQRFLDVQEAINKKADTENVLAKNNTTPYDPTEAYHPATKGYVDELSVKAGAVTSVFGRAGAVTAQAGDYTPEMVGAAPADHAAQHAADGSDPILLHTIGAASNPNLLDNWYFADPIDQRGGYIVPAGTPYYVAGVSTPTGTTDKAYKVERFLEGKFPQITVNGTTYITSEGKAVRGYVGTGYTIDRFVLTSDTLTITDNGVVVAPNAAFRQLFEQSMWQSLGGKDITLSFLVGNTLCSWTTQIDLSASYMYQDFGTYRLAYSSSNRYVHFHNIGTSHTEDIIAAKLELGSVQTLARKEGDAWVLNDPPPNKQQELAKCERYYQVFASAVLNGMTGNDNGHLFLQVPLKTTMRVRPAVNVCAVTYIAGNGQRVDSVTVTPSVQGHATAPYLQFSAATLIDLFGAKQTISAWLSNLALTADL